tara:strand:+ start:679 stop:810 length:132 start_codon:yes stop_codon:yes gene_type:complete
MIDSFWNNVLLAGFAGTFVVITVVVIPISYLLYKLLNKEKKNR